MKHITELDAADAYCRLLAERHYENFTVVSKLLRGRIPVDLMRIYAFCRMTDDYGDESGDAALERLERWRSEVAALFSHQPVVHPVLVALRQTIEHYQLPAQPFLDLIEANVMDQHVKVYDNWAELRAYCMLSAAPVGRMVLGVFQVHGARAHMLSDDVCIGLQLANHAQDVQRDGAMGRCYLLQSDIRQTGIHGAVRALCDRARDLLASGKELETMVPFILRVQLALYRLGGLAITDGIERAGYRTDTVRPEVSKAQKARLLLRAFAQGLRADSHARKLETA